MSAMTVITLVFPNSLSLSVSRTLRDTIFFLPCLSLTRYLLWLSSRWSLVYYCLEDKYEAIRWDFLESFPAELERLSRCLGERTWLMGSRLTYVDFMLYEALDQYALFREGCLDTLPNLKEYAKRFRMLAPIKAYLESERFKPWPVFLPNAKRWGSQKEAPKSLTRAAHAT